MMTQGWKKDKIVVIDDPVSSMDSSALFTIASLVRNMIKICCNNFDIESDGDMFIKQIFYLIHNPFFFKEISYGMISKHEYVSFYEITKDRNNHSHITLRDCNSGIAGGGKVNYSPVRTSYEVLWYEYKSSDDPVILLNVIRRILEYYFLQMCGYKTGSLRASLLDITPSPFKTQDDYNLV